MKNNNCMSKKGISTLLSDIHKTGKEKFPNEWFKACTLLTK